MKKKKEFKTHKKHQLELDPKEAFLLPDNSDQEWLVNFFATTFD